VKSIARQLGLDTRYLLVGFPAAVIGFCLLVTGVSAGLGTLIVGVGIPILAATLWLARALADFERSQLPDVLGRPLATPRYRPAPHGASWLRRMVNPLTTAQSWLDLLHGVLIFPIAVGTFTLAVSWWAVAITGVLYPLYGWILYRALQSQPDNHTLAELLGLGDSLTVEIVFNTALGVLAAVTLPVVLRVAALIQAGVGRALLTGVAALHERIDDLAEGRAAAVSAEANALRKLERDIHDGPQQRLVHLAMELSRAQRQLTRDPGGAEDTLTQAISETREALDELRSLSRGIAPPILSDRGLASALAALGSRCTIPVELDVRTSERYAAAIENAVYFVASESLTNVAKHSGAAACSVSLVATDGTLVLAIGDDGVGGAHVAKGRGLAGLADRLRAVDGELTIDSPTGGPTVIVAEVPCELLSQTMLH
jgi:signal transduction histidine kinase